MDPNHKSGLLFEAPCAPPHYAGARRFECRLRVVEVYGNWGAVFCVALLSAALAYVALGAILGSASGRQARCAARPVLCGS